MNKKITSIIAVKGVLTALCEDGTVWQKESADEPWVGVEGIAQEEGSGEEIVAMTTHLDGVVKEAANRASAAIAKYLVSKNIKSAGHSRIKAKMKEIITWSFTEVMVEKE